MRVPRPSGLTAQLQHHLWMWNLVWMINTNLKQFLFPFSALRQRALLSICTVRAEASGKLQCSYGSRSKYVFLDFWTWIMLMRTVTHGCMADCGFGFEDMKGGGAVRIKKIISCCILSLTIYKSQSIPQEGPQTVSQIFESRNRNLSLFKLSIRDVFRGISKI